MTYNIELPDHLIDLTGAVEAVYTAYTAQMPGMYGIKVEHLIAQDGAVSEPKDDVVEFIEDWICTRHDFWEANGLDPDQAYDQFVDA
jgi:hypothetical protein